MLKILIADDHAVVRRGLKSLVTETWEADVAETAMARHALERALTESWDIVVLDISMPDMSGLEVLRKLKCDQPHIPVLILSNYADDHYIYNSLKAGAAGYLTKEAASDEFVAAITQLLKGQRYLSPSVSKRLNLDDLEIA